MKARPYLYLSKDKKGKFFMDLNHSPTVSSTPMKNSPRYDQKPATNSGNRRKIIMAPSYLSNQHRSQKNLQDKTKYNENIYDCSANRAKKTLSRLSHKLRNEIDFLKTRHSPKIFTPQQSSDEEEHYEDNP